MPGSMRARGQVEDDGAMQAGARELLVPIRRAEVQCASPREPRGERPPGKTRRSRDDAKKTGIPGGMPVNGWRVDC